MSEMDCRVEIHAGVEGVYGKVVASCPEPPRGRSTVISYRVAADVMSQDSFQRLASQMQRIAETVNAFRSESIQNRVFELLVAELRDELLDATAGNNGRTASAGRSVADAGQRPSLAGVTDESMRNAAAPGACTRRPYSMEISLSRKGLFVFLVDQAYSMQDPLGTTSELKMDVAAQMINSWLQNMSIRASGSAGVKDWFDVAVIGYRTDLQAEPIVESAFGGEFAGNDLVSIAQIAEHPVRISTGKREIHDEETGETIETDINSPVWIEAVCEGGRPMCMPFIECTVSYKSGSSSIPTTSLRWCSIFAAASRRRATRDPMPRRSAIWRPTMAVFCYSIATFLTRMSSRSCSPPRSIPAWKKVAKRYSRCRARCPIFSLSRRSPRAMTFNRDRGAWPSIATWLLSSSSWTSELVSPKLCAESVQMTWDWRSLTATHFGA